MIVILVMACSGSFTPTPVLLPTASVTATEEQLATFVFAPTSTIFMTASPVAAQQLPPTLPATVDAVCLGERDNLVARAIVDDFDFTSYTEVMVWFCSGAEFEDIVTALQTEQLSGAAAEDMLEMLADGFSWEEIWQLLGVTE